MNRSTLVLLIALLSWHALPSFAARTKVVERPAPRYHTPLGARTFGINPSFPTLGWPFSDAPSAVPSPLMPKFFRTFRILLDPGHGGHDHGAHSGDGIVEKEICLDLSKSIRKRIEALASRADVPVEVRLTRDSDRFIALRDRVLQANAWPADLFVSVHANAAPSPKPSGFELYFLSAEASDDHTRYLVEKENDGSDAVPAGVQSILFDHHRTNHIEESDRFARSLYETMRKTIQPNVRGVRQGPFTVLNGTSMPAVLVEIGYLTHPDDARKLRQRGYLNRLVDAISSGILQFAAEIRALG